MNVAPLQPGELLRPNAARLTRVTLEVLDDNADRLAAASRVPWDDAGDPDALAAEVSAGRALALAVLHDGRRVGTTFLRVLNRRGTRVLHVIGVEGEFPPGSVRDYFAECERFALTIGCTWLTCETSRPAMIRLFVELGADVAEVRFAKALSHVPA